MGILLKNIKSLYGTDENDIRIRKGKEMDEIGQIDNAWILVEGHDIADYGEMSACPAEDGHETVDLTGKMVIPAFCDSHTHIVFAGPRDGEFEDRIKGLSYEEIARRGGGILNSARKLSEMSEDELFEQSKERLHQVMQTGTGAIEIKSGYGLSMEAELKMLRVIKRLKELNWLPIKSTFLGAHALPLEYKDRKDDYMKLVGEEILPVVASESLADYIDIFCETGYFDVKETEYILDKGLEYGLKGKIHVNQFTVLGGVKAGVDKGAVSVDHLEYVDEKDIEALKDSQTIPTLLPSCSFFLGIPYGPAKEMMQSNLPLALATDYNPGSTPSGNMNFVWSLACVIMKMTPTEALNALTINGAAAMELSDTTGSITKGKLASLIVTKNIPSLAFIPYSFADNQIDRVMVQGKWI